jgi:hypothetical protein
MARTSQAGRRWHGKRRCGQQLQRRAGTTGSTGRDLYHILMVYRLRGARLLAISQLNPAQPRLDALPS